MYTWCIQPIRWGDLQRKLQRSHVENIPFGDVSGWTPYSSSFSLYIQNILVSGRYSFCPQVLRREPPQGHEFISWGWHMKNRGEMIASVVRGSFLGVWTWVSHIGCEMLWSAAAPPAQLLSIFLWVCEFWCHFRLDSRGKMRVKIINGSWDSARCLPASQLELILGEASSRYLGQVYP